MKELKPSLECIEARLTQPSDALAWRIATDESSVPANLRLEALRDKSFAILVSEIREHAEPLQPTLPPPDWAPPVMRQDLIAKIQSASAPPQKRRGSLPASGDIVAIFSAPAVDLSDELDFGAPVLVLLDTNAHSEDGNVLADIWHGWLVASETDYATCWDALICEDDVRGLRTEELGMVQVWNPLQVWLPPSGDHRFAATLKPSALRCVRAIADEYVVAPESKLPAPEPGIVGLRTTASGLTVLTGTLLAGPSDPRWRYQELYGAVADCLGATVRAAAARTRSAEQRTLEHFGDAEEIAAMLSPRGAHPAPYDLDRFAAGDVDDEAQRMAIASHLETCTSCRAELDEFRAILAPNVVRLPDRVGRPPRRLFVVPEAAAAAGRDISRRSGQGVNVQVIAPPGMQNLRVVAIQLDDRTLRPSLLRVSSPSGEVLEQELPPPDSNGVIQFIRTTGSQADKAFLDLLLVGKLQFFGESWMRGGSE